MQDCEARAHGFDMIMIEKACRASDSAGAAADQPVPFATEGELR
jgi:hypothetical protein